MIVGVIFHPSFASIGPGGHVWQRIFGHFAIVVFELGELGRVGWLLTVRRGSDIVVRVLISQIRSWDKGWPGRLVVLALAAPAPAAATATFETAEDDQRKEDDTGDDGGDDGPLCSRIRQALETEGICRGWEERRTHTLQAGLDMQRSHPFLPS